VAKVSVLIFVHILFSNESFGDAPSIEISSHPVAGVELLVVVAALGARSKSAVHCHKK